MSALTPWRRTLLAAAASSLLGMGALAAAAAAPQASYRLRKPQDEVIYFVLPDRFENGDLLRSTVLSTGFSVDALTTFKDF